MRQGRAVVGNPSNELRYRPRGGDRSYPLMGTFFLHIGMHKTASSAAQRLFADRSELLGAHGLHYFPAPHPNHSFFLMTFFAPHGPNAKKSFASPAIKALYLNDRAGLWDRWSTFLTEVGASGDDALVSGEFGGLIAEAEIERLHRGVLEHFDRMIVLMLVRPPLSFAQSSAQQGLKGGHSLAQLGLAPPRPKYRKRLRGYLSVLGRENVRLEIFHRDRLLDGDPARTLLAMMGRNELALAELRAPRINESMSMPAAKLLSALNAMAGDPRGVDTLPRPLLEALRALPIEIGDFSKLEAGKRRRVALPRELITLVRGIPGDRFVLPIEVQRAAPARARADSDWVSRLLGVDLGAFDVAIDENAPTLAQTMAFTTDETKRIAGFLEGRTSEG